MKKIMFFAVLMICIACNNSSKEKSSNENEITELEKYYEVADMFLEFDAEKVGLLSIIK